MKIDVVGAASQVKQDDVKGKVAVVIDVLRATSVMVTAFANGVEQVIPVLSPDDAFNVKDEIGSHVILGGERDANPIPGFDYGNSPLQYSTEVVKGKSLVMTTTNGTLAIKNADEAGELVIASFLNASAVVRYLKEKEDVVFICSGTDGHYTLEDGLCAGYLIDQLISLGMKPELSDVAIATYQMFTANKNDLQKLASQGKHYKNLELKGYERDLQYCFQIGIIDCVPRREGEVIINTTY